MTAYVEHEATPTVGALRYDVIREALKAAYRAERGGCEHEWADARNQAVESGEVCLRCGAVRAGNRLAERGGNDG